MDAMDYRTALDDRGQVPENIVFNGYLYSRSDPNMLSYQQHNSLITAVQDTLNDHDPYDVDAEETDFVQYGGAYFRAFYMDPALIDDSTIRTISEDEHRSRQPQLLAIPYVAPQPVPPPPAAQPQVVPQGQLQLPRPMPALSPIERGEKLRGLFDLLPNQRFGIQYVKPPEYNYGINGRGQRLVRWTADEKRYLWMLVECGMRLLGRILRVGDYHAVTEALHRRFAGSGHVRRGYSTVNTYVVKDPNYAAFTARVMSGQ